MADRLTPAQIDAALAAHPTWSFDGSALTRTFDCRDFDGSIAFVNAVAGAANRLDHHPDIALSWNAVTIRTWSHDVDAITARDVDLVAALDETAANLRP
jgi:4a-hydroxytetrahydrobiopterin dehydratase